VQTGTVYILRSEVLVVGWWDVGGGGELGIARYVYLYRVVGIITR
jgi:hypothetical protein